MSSNRSRASLRRTLCSTALLVVTALTMVGCKSGGQSKYDLAVEENQELRRRVAALDTASTAAEREAQQLRTENERLRQENSELTTAMAEMSQQVTAQPASPNFGTLPPGVSVSQRGSDVVVAVAGDVLFDSGKATLRKDANSTLQRVADIVRSRYSNSLIRVEGYTDTDPIKKSGWKSNEHLSAERAITVEQFLVGRGIDNSRIYSAAFGPAHQRSTKQESRRVEIVVLAPEG